MHAAAVSSTAATRLELCDGALARPSKRKVVAISCDPVLQLVEQCRNKRADAQHYGGSPESCTLRKTPELLHIERDRIQRMFLTVRPGRAHVAFTSLLTCGRIRFDPTMLNTPKNVL
jgi:hypothetical protein